MSTLEIDTDVEEFIQAARRHPAFKGYRDSRPVCISINEEVVHGIPSAQRHVEGGRHRRSGPGVYR
jgi:methionyl aminopeptidase